MHTSNHVNMWSVGFVLLVGVIALCLAAPAGGDTIVLSDLNATMGIDLEAATGMSSWTVDGTEQLKRQWFWLRVGGTGAESPLNSLALSSYTVSDGNFNAGNDRVVAKYTGATLEVVLDVMLTGGSAGSGASDLTESISIKNTSGDELSLHFFQYADFDLDGDATDASVSITGSPANRAKQSDGSSVSESIVTGEPDHFEVATYSDILDALTDGDADDLGDLAGPITDDDLTWAFQWDRVLSPGESLLISKKKNLVPEPGALAILAIGAVAALRRRRR